jgi:hypothetical protein
MEQLIELIRAWLPSGLYADILINLPGAIMSFSERAS